LPDGKPQITLRRIDQAYRLNGFSDLESLYKGVVWLAEELQTEEKRFVNDELDTAIQQI